ncbi:hypothetical protein TWF694_006339 [Orbilia ellipsospora]|uniref:F-box domain-containing protein n=1 Tax=Orbilia ellipsospora TaxID=2528407 RepID=A0AAV9XK73_9PEZI
MHQSEFFFDLMYLIRENSYSIRSVIVETPPDRYFRLKFEPRGNENARKRRDLIQSRYSGTFERTSAPESNSDTILPILTVVEVAGVMNAYNFTRELTLNNSDIRSLQLKLCIRSSDEESDSIRYLFGVIPPLHTLQLCHIDNGDWDPDLVLFHRRSLKRLWLECHMGHQFGRTGPSRCEFGAEFFDPDHSPLRFMSDNWPLLEELAIPSVDWYKLPKIHTVTVLRLLNHLKGGLSKQTQHELVETYAAELARESNSQYHEPPKLKVIVFEPNGVTLGDTRPIYYLIHFMAFKPQVSRTRDIYRALRHCHGRGYLLMQRQSIHRVPWDADVETWRSYYENDDNEDGYGGDSEYYDDSSSGEDDTSIFNGDTSSLDGGIVHDPEDASFDDYADPFA